MMSDSEPTGDNSNHHDGTNEPISSPSSRRTRTMKGEVMGLLPESSRLDDPPPFRRMEEEEEVVVAVKEKDGEEESERSEGYKRIFLNHVEEFRNHLQPDFEREDGRYHHHHHHHHHHPIAGPSWNRDEVERFHRSLARNSRFRPDLISIEVGTKSLVEVWRYLCDLERCKAQVELQEQEVAKVGGFLREGRNRGMSWKEMERFHDWRWRRKVREKRRRRIRDHPIAIEVDEAWIRSEEREAEKLVGLEEVIERRMVNESRLSGIVLDECDPHPPQDQGGGSSETGGERRQPQWDQAFVTGGEPGIEMEQGVWHARANSATTASIITRQKPCCSQMAKDQALFSTSMPIPFDEQVASTVVYLRNRPALDPSEQVENFNLVVPDGDQDKGRSNTSTPVNVFDFTRAMCELISLRTGKVRKGYQRYSETHPCSPVLSKEDAKRVIWRAAEMGFLLVLEWVDQEGSELVKDPTGRVFVRQMTPSDHEEKDSSDPTSRVAREGALEEGLPKVKVQMDATKLEGFQARSSQICFLSEIEEGLLFCWSDRLHRSLKSKDEVDQTELGAGSGKVAREGAEAGTSAISNQGVPFPSSIPPPPPLSSSSCLTKQALIAQSLRSETLLRLAKEEARTRILSSLNSDDLVWIERQRRRKGGGRGGSSNSSRYQSSDNETSGYESSGGRGFTTTTTNDSSAFSDDQSQTDTPSRIPSSSSPGRATAPNESPMSLSQRLASLQDFLDHDGQPIKMTRAGRKGNRGTGSNPPSSIGEERGNENGETEVEMEEEEEEDRNLRSSSTQVRTNKGSNDGERRRRVYYLKNSDPSIVEADVNRCVYKGIDLGYDLSSLSEVDKVRIKQRLRSHARRKGIRSAMEIGMERLTLDKGRRIRRVEGLEGLEHLISHDLGGSDRRIWIQFLKRKVARLGIEEVRRIADEAQEQGKDVEEALMMGRGRGRSRSASGSIRSRSGSTRIGNESGSTSRSRSRSRSRRRRDDAYRDEHDDEEGEQRHPSDHGDIDKVAEAGSIVPSRSMIYESALAMSLKRRFLAIGLGGGGRVSSWGMDDLRDGQEDVIMGSQLDKSTAYLNFQAIAALLERLSGPLESQAHFPTTLAAEGNSEMPIGASAQDGRAVEEPVPADPKETIDGDGESANHGTNSPTLVVPPRNISAHALMALDAHLRAFLTEVIFEIVSVAEPTLVNFGPVQYVNQVNDRLVWASVARLGYPRSLSKMRLDEDEEHEAPRHQREGGKDDWMIRLNPKLVPLLREQRQRMDPPLFWSNASTDCSDGVERRGNGRNSDDLAYRTMVSGRSQPDRMESDLVIATRAFDRSLGFEALRKSRKNPGGTLTRRGEREGGKRTGAKGAVGGGVRSTVDGDEGQSKGDCGNTNPEGNEGRLEREGEDSEIDNEEVDGDETWEEEEEEEGEQGMSDLLDSEISSLYSGSETELRAGFEEGDDDDADESDASAVRSEGSLFPARTMRRSGRNEGSGEESERVGEMEEEEEEVLNHLEKFGDGYRYSRRSRPPPKGAAEAMVMKGRKRSRSGEGEDDEEDGEASNKWERIRHKRRRRLARYEAEEVEWEREMEALDDRRDQVELRGLYLDLSGEAMAVSPS
ncbi:hypothetical protein IE53DRAFT_367307 [Violaceomyces palustris]|uniref:Uncharacterized protein n=1 Tax=Violaceomyces palustris TaxID=1673888 RepID=A0ACD0P2N2_9BASI|nr:hypothetical protein IE53DRAFT_367307 [Violaceomyces palustris]